MRPCCLGLATAVVAVAMHGCSDDEVSGSATQSGDKTATSSPGDTASSGGTGQGTTGVTTPSGASTSDSTDESTTPGVTGGTTSTTPPDETSSSGCDGGVCLDVGAPDAGGGSNCGESNWVVTPEPSNVLFVLDASGSMVNPALYWDHDDDPGTPDISRWNSLHNVVELIVDTFDFTLDMGVLMFPMPGDPVDCDVGNDPQVPVMPLGGASIMAALPPKDAYDELWGNPTPTADALGVAVNHLVTLDPAVPRALVLVSDGVVSEPCFNTHEEALAVIAGAFQSEGIPTYVVGVRITPSWVDGYNEWAAAGGVPLGGANDFYDVRNEIELLDALQQIAAMEVSCLAPLSPQPNDPTKVQIRLNDEIVPPATDCASDDGWVYVHPAGPYDAIELCGSYCDEFKAAGGEVLALYGCPPEG